MSLSSATPSEAGRGRGKGGVGLRRPTIPLVKIEATLGADLSAEQLRSYAANLASRTQPLGLQATLVVLVTAVRTREAKAVIRQTFAVGGDAPWRTTAHPTVATGVLSWPYVFAALALVESSACREEARQLHGLYRGTYGNHIVPPRSVEDRQAWRVNEKVHVSLVDQVASAHREK